jgi:hypothetical protein
MDSIEKTLVDLTGLHENVGTRHVLSDAPEHYRAYLVPQQYIAEVAYFDY